MFRRFIRSVRRFLARWDPPDETCCEPPVLIEARPLQPVQPPPTEGFLETYSEPMFVMDVGPRQPKKP
jgi:hypothetical protein